MEKRPSVRDDELSCELLRMIEIVEGKGFHREIAIENPDYYAMRNGKQTSASANLNLY